MNLALASTLAVCSAVLSSVVLGAGPGHTADSPAPAAASFARTLSGGDTDPWD